MSSMVLACDVCTDVEDPLSVDKMISSILRMYDSAPPVFNSISSLANLLGWTEVADKTSLEYLRSQEVDDRWSLEFVEAITRINYGQVRDSTLVAI